MRTEITTKFVDVGAEEESAIVAVLRRGKLAGTAGIVREYESDLQSFFNVPYALACSNGTYALYLALSALGVGNRDEVILPPTAPVMTAMPILSLGAIPVFADVLAHDNFGFDVQDLSNKLSPRTKAIVTVPMWGRPIDMQSLLMLAKAANIPVVEDAAQAHGTIANGNLAGTIGTIGCFSTHERKLICTGEGGFVLTNDPYLNARITELRNFGRPAREIEGLEDFRSSFGAVFGMNLKLPALSAALGRVQIRKLKDRIARRRTNSLRLSESLSAVTWLREFPFAPDSTPNYYAYVASIDPAAGNAKQLGNHLAEKGVISDTHDYDYRPLYEVPAFRSFRSDCPNAESLTAQTITLPIHEGLTEEDAEYISKSVQSFRTLAATALDHP